MRAHGKKMRAHIKRPRADVQLSNFDPFFFFFFLFLATLPQVKLEEKEAEIVYDPNIVEANFLKNTIETLGDYSATLLKNYSSNRFFITGMRCQNCVRKIQSKVGEIQGVREVKVRTNLLIASGSGEGGGDDDRVDHLCAA